MSLDAVSRDAVMVALGDNLAGNNVAKILDACSSISIVAGASQAAIGAYTSATLTDSTGGTPGATISNVTGSFSQSVLNNNFSSIAAQVNALIVDIGTVKTLVNAIRTALVTEGIIKGSA